MRQTDDPNFQTVELVAEIVTAYVRKNTVPIGELPELIKEVHSALSGAEADTKAAADKLNPAVAVRSSVKPAAIICLECGNRHKSLKRHLSSAHSLTPSEYRERWNLSKDYPMVAPDYSAARSALAKRLGLGRKPA